MDRINTEVGEPPPTDEDDWIDSVITGIIPTSNDSTLQAKPTIATVVLEEPTQSHHLMKALTSNIDIHPVNIVDEAKIPLSTSVPDEKNHESINDVDIMGEILAPEDNIDTLADDDPVLQSMQSAQELLNQSWTPSLNSVEEEQEVDIRIKNGDPIVKSTMHVSYKRQRG